VTINRYFSVCAMLIISLLASTGVAQDFTTLPPRGQFRDAAIDLERGHLFVAVYDQNSLWRIDPATGKIATKIRVGRGPAALTMDGALLACANRLDNTVTIVKLTDLSIAATVEVGEGPGAVTALGDGRFIVANTFSDTLSLIDTRGTISVTSLPDAPSVPTAVATTSTHIVVASRADGQLYCFARNSLTLAKRVSLPEAAVRLIAAGNDAVFAASKRGLHLVDIGTGSLLKTVNLRANGLSYDGKTLHVVTGSSYATFSRELAPVETRPLSGEASAIAARGSVLALLDPKSKRLQTHNLELLRPALNAAPAAPVESTPSESAPDERTLVIVEAAPVEESAGPAPQTESTNEEPAPPATPVSETEAPTEETAAAPVMAEEPPAEEPAKGAENTPMMVSASPPSTVQSDHGVRKNPIITGGVRAPSPGRPSASPLDRLSKGTITDALIRPTEFGASEGGFQALDLTKPLDNIKFSTAKRDSTAAPTLYSDFEAKHGDLQLRSNAFTHKLEPVEINAEGDVLITQQSSSITADRIQYRLEPTAATEEKQGEPVFESNDEGGGSPLDQGRLTLDNAHIVEPTREMTADHLDYDFATGKGEVTNAKGKAGIYYFSADKLHLHGPQSLEGDNVWVTTCDRPNPHYKIRLSGVELVDGQPKSGSNARLQLGKANTPLYLPKWRRGGAGGSPWNVSFDSGRQAETGYYLDVGQQYEVNPDVSIGPRIFATEKEGVGFGADLSYDFMENPAARLYRTRGEAHGLYTTEERGYVHWYHRYEYSKDLTVRAQVEHWGDQDFYKDFYYDAFRNRSQPRSFANVTYRKPSYIATGTVRMQTHGWFNQTEQAPEATYHLLERNVAENLYFTFDTINGFYNREPRGVDGGRSVNVARLTYDLDLHPALAITPFLQLDGSLYTRDRRDSGSTGQFGGIAGVTAQSRFSRTFGGRWGFSAFKHVVLPSVTYTYRPESSLDAPEVPQFDPLDSDFGRSRIEFKLDNVFYGRDAESGDVWQVGRVSLYLGNDIWNETRQTEDYEIEIDVRPRPWWGFQLVAERQNTSEKDDSLGQFSLARNYPRFYETVIGDIFGGVNAQDFSAQFGDYNRMLSQLYYDDTARGGKVSGRVGFSYTETQGRVFNREAIYGLGYKLNDKWGFGFEHTYDFEDSNLRSQTYELRRSLHCWETAIRFRERESGFDINFEFNIKAFPGSRLKFWGGLRSFRHAIGE
jgi:lipopolysaccharide assembly outer membrane protein LptD (OstA)